MFGGGGDFQSPKKSDREFHTVNCTWVITVVMTYDKNKLFSSQRSICNIADKKKRLDEIWVIKLPTFRKPLGGGISSDLFLELFQT